MAIDRNIWIAAEATDTPEVELESLEFGEAGSFALGTYSRADVLWIEYSKGVAWALDRAGYPVRGFRGIIAGDVPIGAGLSSSAALEMAVIRLFAEIGGFDISVPEMAALGRAVENEWIGASTGIMDQTISAGGVAGHAVLLDCRSLERTPVPLPSGTVVIVLDTSTRRGLVGSAYNERHAQCEAGARHFGVHMLRDVTPEALARDGGGLDETTRRRVRHVVSENAPHRRRGGSPETGRRTGLRRADEREPCQHARRFRDLLRRPGRHGRLRAGTARLLRRADDGRRLRRLRGGAGGERISGRFRQERGRKLQGKDGSRRRDLSVPGGRRRRNRTAGLTGWAFRP